MESIDAIDFDKIIKQLIRNLEKVNYGSCGITLTIHNGVVTRVDYSKTEKLRSCVNDS